jgi:P4 family phage/plasmid primase-like protien
MKVPYDTSGAVPDALRPYLVGEGPKPDGEWDMFCPLHEDSTRSARFNYIDGIWVCFKGCGHGSVKDLLKRQSEFVPRSAVSASLYKHQSSSNGRVERLSEKRVRQWAAELLKSESRLEEFQDLRGIWRKTIVDFEIGWDERRRAYTIPIRDQHGKLVNIRRYQPKPSPGRRKIWSVTGHGQPRLYPLASLQSNVIIICEGELDALITSQNGYPAMTRTASAVTWRTDWSELFKDKLVYVCHDCDKAGSEADRKVLDSLTGIAREVRTLRLPYDRTEKHGKDLTDWWMEHDGDREAFERLMTGAKKGQVIRLPRKTLKAPRLDQFDLTDDGNARKFISQHRGRLVYAEGAGWFKWSRQHYKHDRHDRRLWRPIDPKSVLKDVKRTVRTLRDESMLIENPEERFQVQKWVKRSLSTAGLKACRDSVEAGDPDMADLVIGVNELDRNPDVINTPSGIVDLRDGQIKEHSPFEFCTMITNAACQPADYSEWQSFLNMIMPDRKLQGALQLCLGASITARPTRGVFVLYGPKGENGKTQLIQAVAHAIGTYAKTAHEGTFTTSSSREAGYDMAGFRGIRFASFAETRSGHGLASERIKRVTGDETISARHPYERSFEYRPQFSLWVTTNFAPYIPASDSAMWKRVWVWKMDEVIPREKQIPDYGRKLGQEHGPAILSWLIKGAQAFYLNGCRLGRAPKQMEEFREAWQERDDIVARWIEERTVDHPDGKVRLADLWRDFRLWAEEQGEDIALRTYTAQKFHQEIDQRFTEYPRSEVPLHGSATRLGLMLKLQGGLQ